MSEPKKLEVRTADGVAPCWVHRPESPDDPGATALLPAVVLFPDAGSVRRATHEIAQRVASWGHVVLMPHIFYRMGDYAPFDPATVFGDPKERERLMTIVRSLDLASAMRDAGSYIDAVLAEPGVAADRVLTMGYCIGGRLAFATAGAHPARVAAAASIHGGGLVGDAPDSPHLAADKIQAQLYFGIADDDASCSPAHQAKLVEALASAHVRFTIDHYDGRKHGFAMSDFPVYDERAAAQQWARIEELFASATRAR